MLQGGPAPSPVAHARADPDARATPTPGAHGDARPDVVPGQRRAPDRRRRPRRVREHPLRAGAGGAPLRRLRNLWRRDREGRGGAPAPRGADRVGLAVSGSLMAAVAVPGAGLAVEAAADPTRLPLRTVLAGSAVVALVRPVAWALGLVGFLAGGGLAVVAWPIVVLPTPTGLQNALGGPVSTLVFGAASPRLLLLIVGAVGAAVALLVAGVVAGAWAERQGIGVALEAAEEEGLTPAARRSRRSTGRRGRAASPSSGSSRWDRSPSSPGSRGRRSTTRPTASCSSRTTS